MIFYRKYRPQSFEDLIGQEGVKKTLLAAISADKLSHAYLFCGPRGTGKTSTARILAKVVNCENNNVPCNKCVSCISITDGTNLDVVEMDAASNRGIEDIRALRETIKLASTGAKKKVYIIDEVHMLTTEAFNALLKVLEEPPTHVMFILATTDPQKIPPTILSRVVRLDFKTATLQELVDSFKKVANSEKLKVDDDAMLLIAKQAQGSFRDGIKFLDMLSSGGKIDVKSIELVLNGSSFETICEILGSISRKDGVGALTKFLAQLELGVTIKEFNLNLLDTLRSLMLIKNGLGERLVKGSVGEEKYQTLSKLAEGFTLLGITKTIEKFQKSLEEARFTPIPSLPLEVAIVESCQEGVIASEAKKIVPDSDHSAVPQDGKIEEVVAPVIDIQETSQEGLDDIQKIQDKWGYVLETVKQYNFSLEALLRSVKIIECTKGDVIIEVPYSFHQRILSAPKSRDLLESILSDVLARTVRVSTVLGQRKVDRDELANVEIAADDEIVRLASEIFSSDPVN